MINIQPVEHFIPEHKPFTVPDMEDISATFNDQHTQRRTPTSLRTLRVFLMELVIKLKESLVHEDFYHLGQVAGLV